MWRIEHCAARKTWAVSHVRRSRKKDQSHHEGIVPKRQAPHDRQAAGILCKVPGMDAHALAAETRTRQTRRTLVQCEYCGGRGLTLRYLPVNEAISRNRLHRT